MTGILIAGGGLAAQRACETLRRTGYDGRLRVIAVEPDRPYDRPPLPRSTSPGNRRDGTDVQGRRLVRRERRRAAARQAGDPPRPRRARSHALRRHPDAYEQLLIATGSSPRRLPIAAGYENVHELRTLDDARALRAALAPGTPLAVIGAGFIGQEVAATAKRLGAEVTLIEAAEVPLATVLGPRLGAWFARLHQEEGIEVLLSAYIERLHGAAPSKRSSSRTAACRVRRGRRRRRDRAGHELAEGSGLEPAGVLRRLRRAHRVPGVFAAGDASRPSTTPWHARRTEHWEAAARQGAAAARAMLGLHRRRRRRPELLERPARPAGPVRRAFPRRRRVRSTATGSPRFHSHLQAAGGRSPRCSSVARTLCRRCGGTFAARPR